MILQQKETLTDEITKRRLDWSCFMNECQRMAWYTGGTTWYIAVQYSNVLYRGWTTGKRETAAELDLQHQGRFQRYVRENVRDSTRDRSTVYSCTVTEVDETGDIL